MHKAYLVFLTLIYKSIDFSEYPIISHFSKRVLNVMRKHMCYNEIVLFSVSHSIDTEGREEKSNEFYSNF